MRCTNCGWNNPDGLRFCQKCSEPLISYEGIHSTPVPSDIPQSREQKNSVESDSVPIVEPQTDSATANSIEPAAGKSTLSCRKCGYPLMADSDSCPNCGAQIKKPVCAELSAGEAHDAAIIDGRATRKMISEIVDETKTPATQSFANATVMDVTLENSGKSKKLFNLRETIRDASFVGAAMAGQQPVQDSEHPETPEHSELVIRQIDAVGMEVDKLTSSGDTLKINQASFTITDGKWMISETPSSSSVYVKVSRPIEIVSGDVLVIDGNRYKVE